MVNGVKSLISYGNYLKTSDELPKHITFVEYKNLRDKVTIYYDGKNIPSRKKEFLKVRDKLLIDFIFATGGRIGDVVQVLKADINFETQILTLRIKKTKTMININLDRLLCYDILNYVQKYEVQDRLFRFGGTAAWYIVKKLGRFVGIPNLHPHMFRHGLALHLLSSGIPINVISFRLGHRNPRTTIEMYLKVTPEIEKQILDGIQWR